MGNTLHVSYFNYENGGVLNPEAGPNGPFRYDFNGLVRVVGANNEWPDILMMGEGYCYHLEQGKVAKEAAITLQRASKKPYFPFIGALPGNWSVAPPVMFVNTATIKIIRWHHPSDADFAWSKYNLLEVVHKETKQPFHAIVIHGYTDDGDKRLADAKMLRRYGDGERNYPCIVGGDWCAVPS